MAIMILEKASGKAMVFELGVNVKYDVILKLY